MRATMTIEKIEPNEETSSETFHLKGTTDGSAQLARFAPEITFTMVVTNPALSDRFAVGDTIYVDFTKA